MQARRDSPPTTEIVGRTISITAADGGRFDAYLAVPDRTPAPALLVVVPIFGVTDEMQRVVDRYASRGYVAIAPDPFWRVQPGTLPRTDEGRAQASARAKQVDVQRELDDLRVTLETLRAMPECSGKVGVVGFCFGGRYAFLAAAQLDVQAAAGFHPTQIGASLDAAPAVKVPLSLHYGEIDPVTPPDEIAATRAALAGKPGIEIMVHPGAAHNFSLEGIPGYNAEAARISDERAFALFEGLR
jgi:carboxymethylenebutenolidase